MSWLKYGNTFMATSFAEVSSYIAMDLHSAQNDMSFGIEAPRLQSSIDASLRPERAASASGRMLCLCIVVLSHF